jgi:hypothetical protein
MSTPSPRQASFTPSQSRQLAKWWAPLWSGNRALVAARTAHEVADACLDFFEAFTAWRELSPYAPQACVALLECVLGRLQDLQDCLARQAPDVVRLFGHHLQSLLAAGAEYYGTSLISPRESQKVARSTP